LASSRPTSSAPSVTRPATVVGTPSIVNTTKLVGPQAEPSIAINPANPAQMFVASNSNFQSIVFSRSNDAGATWTPETLFNGSNAFPQALGNPSLATDKYGNLFMAYRTLATNAVIVLLSYDAGQTFHIIKSIKTTNGQPIVATGDNSVWVALRQEPQTGARRSVRSGGAVAYGAQVFGLGRVKAFKPELITSVQATVTDLSVGPPGQVSAAYTFSSETIPPSPETGPQQIYVSTDPDGLGRKGFGTANTQVTTQVGTQVIITTQDVAGITPSPSIAYDRSADLFTGRLYLAYVDAPSPTSEATNIELRFSDDNGATWSSPVQVNDDASGKSHFDPRVSVDPITGAVAVTWYDARNDNGLPPNGGTNSFSNDDVQVYGAVGTPTPTGVSFSPNFVVQPAFSNPNDVVSAAGAALTPASELQFGDRTGAVFNNSQLFPAWADNSNSTADNGDGLLAQPDIYVGHAVVQVTGSPTGTFIGSFGDTLGTLTYHTAAGTKVTFQLHHGIGFVVLNGSSLSLHLSGTSSSSTLNIRAAGGSGSATLGDTLVNGPIGSINAPQLDLTGTFSVQGAVTQADFRNVSGGTFAATGAIGRITLASLTSGKILSGANAGGDGVFAGSTDTDDTFGIGSIAALMVRGTITNSVVGAGVNPVNGIFGDGNDQIVGGSASVIRLISARSADSTPRFEAGAFGVARLPANVNTASDPRFVS
jgi:hypothetical protein